MLVDEFCMEIMRFFKLKDFGEVEFQLIFTLILAAMINTFSARLYPKLTKKWLKKSKIPNFAAAFRRIPSRSVFLV